MSQQDLLHPANAQLVMLDMQQAPLDSIECAKELLERCIWLSQLASSIGVPKLLTEHCVPELGPTTARLRACFSDSEVVAKDYFSLWSERAARDKLELEPVGQVVLAGIQCHSSVLQSAFELQHAGWQVFLVADATGSRRALDYDLSIERLRDGGIRIVSAEMVLYEWTRRGSTPLFEQLKERLLR